MAVDSIVPDMPAMRIIPVARLLPGDELRGHYERSPHKAWIVYPWPITVTSVIDTDGGWIHAHGKLTDNPGTAPVLKILDATNDVLVTFHGPTSMTQEGI